MTSGRGGLAGGCSAPAAALRARPGRRARACARSSRSARRRPGAAPGAWRAGAPAGGAPVTARAGFSGSAAAGGRGWAFRAGRRRAFGPQDASGRGAPGARGGKARGSAASRAPGARTSRTFGAWASRTFGARASRAFGARHGGSFRGRRIGSFRGGRGCAPGSSRPGGPGSPAPTRRRGLPRPGSFLAVVRRARVAPCASLGLRRGRRPPHHQQLADLLHRCAAGEGADLGEQGGAHGAVVAEHSYLDELVTCQRSFDFGKHLRREPGLADHDHRFERMRAGPEGLAGGGVEHRSGCWPSGAFVGDGIVHPRILPAPGSPRPAGSMAASRRPPRGALAPPLVALMQPAASRALHRP